MITPGARSHGVGEGTSSTTWYKDPDEVLDYMLEWAVRFNDTEEIVSSAGL